MLLRKRSHPTLQRSCVWPVQQRRYSCLMMDIAKNIALDGKYCDICFNFFFFNISNIVIFYNIKYQPKLNFFISFCLMQLHLFYK